MIKLNDKIILRKPESADIDDLLKVKNNADTAQLLGGVREKDYSMEDIMKWIDFHNNNPNEVLYVIYDTELQAVIGHVGLYNIDQRVHKAEFGILIGCNNCQGKGYGSLCLEYMLKIGFEQLELNRIELSFLDENIPALKLYEKFGFKIEGVQREAQFKNDRYYDVILMAILKDDY